jgi:hypothetical protein
MGSAPGTGEGIRDRIRAHLETVLAGPDFSGSARHAAVLRYLVDRALADETPHEIDIAIDVFGKDHSYDPAESSSVRVGVHQVRKKLEAHYSSAPPPEGDIRLGIPKGSYRVSFGISLLEAQHASLLAQSADRDPNRIPARRGLLSPAAAAVAAAMVLSVAANAVLLLRGSRFPDAPAAVPVPTTRDPPGAFAWSDLAEGPEPILIGLGDVFFFTETREQSGSRFVRDVDINSAEDLRRLAAEDYGSTVLPSEMTYLPKATAFALAAILPVARATGKNVALKLMSDITAQDLRENDVIYIGLLRSMGVLQDYFFRSSDFYIEPPFLELHQKSTGKTFTWSGRLFGPTHDYGLFSKLAGPGEGELFVLTGLSGAGMLQAVQALTDARSAEQVERDVRAGAEAFPEELEILFEVSGYDREALDGKIVSPATIAAR